MMLESKPSTNRRLGLRVIGGLTLLPWVSSQTLLAAPGTRAEETKNTQRTIRVESGSPVSTLSQAARVAKDGDTVEVASGDYRADVAVWTQRDLVIRGIGTRPRLIADGASAEAKATFVMKGDVVRIENLAFHGARVRDRNGAGIRLEKGSLEIAGCHFEDNENGILTGNNQEIELAIDRCSFVENGAGDGRSHNLYAGAIGRLTVSSSYFARARVGHLFKSRARENLVVYCRLSGEDGSASYELEFPNGGVAQVLGCLIQQGPQSENPTIVSYGVEGYRWPRNELQLAFNTIVNDRPQGGTFVRLAAGNVRAELLDNLLVGSGVLDVKTDTALIKNTVGRRSEFVDAPQMDYQLKKASRHVGAAGAVGQLPAGRAYPERQYVHPADSRPLPAVTALTQLSPGAFQRLAD